MRIVIALGGNALEGIEETGTVGATAAQLADVIGEGHELIVTHGNGPQVGELMLDQEARREDRPTGLPLDVLVAMTQAQLGYLLQREVEDELVARGDHTDVVTIVTEVVVDPTDPEFERPSKPVGPRYRERPDDDHDYVELDDGRWRRVVPSPTPRHLVEHQALRAIVEDGIVPVCGGGGGVPVVRHGDRLRGVEAVIDKDETSALIASVLDADALVILTDVPHVERHHGTPDATPIAELTASEASDLLGDLPAGSMRPKVRAAVRAAEEGRMAVIAQLGDAVDALAGRSGTRIVADRA